MRNSKGSISIEVFSKAVPWLRRSTAGLSSWRPGFAPVSVHEGFMVDKVTQTGFSPSTLVFPCRCHSTVAPCLYIIWRMNNRPVGCRSSDTVSPLRHEQQRDYGSKVLSEIFGPQKEEGIMRCSIICTLHIILLGRSNQGEWGGQDMWHAWEKRGMCTRFWWESQKVGRPSCMWEVGIRMDLMEIG
jgi:hypothetical protein